MTGQTGANYYEKGLKLAEAGKYQEGLNCIREHLRSAPHDAQALNDAGAILHCLGRTEDAIEHLTKAWKLKSDHAEIVWNLVEAYLAAGMPSEVVPLFDHVERLGLLSVEVLNRTASMLLDQGKKGEAVEVLLRSYRRWPEQEVLKPMLDVIHTHRPKVAFLCSEKEEDGRLADICEFVRQRFQTEFSDGCDRDRTVSLTRWADILWIDGGGDAAVSVSQSGRDCKTIVSLRPSDVQGNWARNVQWEHVDMVVQIGSCAVEEALLQQVPDIHNRTRLVVVPYGVNLDRCVLRRRERGKNLVCTGRLTAETNPAFVLQCMQKLHYIDSGYRLFFSGPFGDPILEQYIRHMVQRLSLRDVVFFEPGSGDWNAWLSDKHFIVAGGIGEGQTEALLAGMACGLKPVIHSFPGAEKLFAAEYLFDIAEQFCDRVRSSDYDPGRYRQLVEERYAIHQQLSRVDGILTQFEREIGSRTPGCPGESSRTGENAEGPGTRSSDIRRQPMPSSH